MTIEELLVEAYGKSKKNQPTQIATEATELLTVANRVVRTFVQIGTRVNPQFFGGENPVSFISPGWARPADAEAVYRIESVGTEVVVVPFDDRAAEATKPSVYRLGQIYRPAGLANDPSGDLDFFYARRPVDATDITDTIDALWPVAYAELAVLELAAYLAQKDDRLEELGALATERDKWLLLYLSFLEHETMNERRRFRQEVQTSTLIPISSMLTGGSEVSV